MQSTPSHKLLGTVNGANQAFGALCRAIGPAIASAMFSKSMETSRPWMVWRYGLGIFSLLLWIAAWFLTDEICLPSLTDYIPVDDRDNDDPIVQEIEGQVDHLQRDGQGGIIDVEEELNLESGHSREMIGKAYVEYVPWENRQEICIMPKELVKGFGRLKVVYVGLWVVCNASLLCI